MDEELRKKLREQVSVTVPLALYNTLAKEAEGLGELQIKLGIERNNAGALRASIRHALSKIGYRIVWGFDSTCRIYKLPKRRK